MSEEEYNAATTPGPVSQEQGHLTCSVCLDTFKDPKMLACHHTFCEACIQALLVSGHSNSLQCPQCRKQMRLSLEEVPRLQTNFYLTPLLEKAQLSDNCHVHREEETRFICCDCDTAVCCLCILQEHKNHDLKDMEKAKEEIRADLKNGVAQFDNVLTKLNTKLEADRLRVQTAEAKRKDFQSVLTRRAEKLHATIDSQLANAFTSVNELVYPIVKNKQELEQKIELVQWLREDLEKTVASKANYKQLVTAKNELQANEHAVAHEPVCETGAEQLQESDLRGFPVLYGIHRLPRSKTIASLLGLDVSLDHTVVLHKAFQSCPGASPFENNVLVHALCISVDGCVWVAYGYAGSKGKGWVARFSPSGCLLSTPVAIEGRVCLAGFPSGSVRVEGKYHGMLLTAVGQKDPEPDWRALQYNTERLCGVYNKMDARFLLWQHSNLECELVSMALPANGECCLCKVLLSQTPVAMDASQDGKLFAVVEGKESHVVLFHLDKGCKPFSVFRGKFGCSFEPLDVCFYVTRGEERLVVADGASKSLMVLEVDQNFGCELVDEMKVTPSDSPGELYKPTALCPDRHDKLWVGCLGGQLVCMSPYNPSNETS